MFVVVLIVSTLVNTVISSQAFFMQVSRATQTAVLHNNQLYIFAVHNRAEDPNSSHQRHLPQVTATFQVLNWTNGNTFNRIFVCFLSPLTVLHFRGFVSSFHCWILCSCRPTTRAAWYLAQLNRTVLTVLCSGGRREMTVGETTNLMSIDTQKFMDLVLYLNMIWSRWQTMLYWIWV